MKNVRMPNGWRALLLAATLALIATPALAAADPTADVKSLVNHALAVVRNKEMSLAAKRSEFRIMAERDFDVVGMAHDSLQEHWPQLSADQQNKFSHAFGWIVADTYLGQIRDFAGEQVQIISQDLAGGGAEVSGNILTGNEAGADLKFKLRKIEGKWKVRDYSFNADSAMQKYRGDFKQAFETGGFDGLMARLNTLQAKLDADLSHRSDAPPPSLSGKSS